MTQIDYFYSAHSAYAYLGAQKLYEICAAHDVVLVHRPILLSPVVEAVGGPSFAGRTQAHVDYFFGREIERWAAYRNVPIVNYRPTYHDTDYSLASGMIIALGQSGSATDRMAHAVLEAHWRDDIDLSDKASLHRIAASLGHNADQLLAQAGSDTIQAILQGNSTWAKDQSVFGSPTYIVDGDPFYGQDRLELVQAAVKQPFAPTDWVNPPVD